MLKQNNKKATHVGFVVSFVLFITFLVFMYAILSSRVDLGKEKQNSLNYAKAEIMERISGNMTSVSVSISEQGVQRCVRLIDFFLKTEMGNRFVVGSDSGDVLQSGKDGNDLFVERDRNIFFRVYGSEEFNISGEALRSCQALSEESEGYSLGLSRDSKDIFESKVLRLFKNYTEDYGALKRDMRIGPGNEFGFGFAYNNGTEIKTPEENATINIYAERTSIQYIKRDGTRESGFMEFMAW